LLSEHNLLPISGCDMYVVVAAVVVDAVVVDVVVVVVVERAK